MLLMIKTQCVLSKCSIVRVSLCAKALRCLSAQLRQGLVLLICFLAEETREIMYAVESYYVFHNFFKINKCERGWEIMPLQYSLLGEHVIYSVSASLTRISDTWECYSRVLCASPCTPST